MEDRWGKGPPKGASAVERLAYLSNRIGDEALLVQPGGGNSSIKEVGTNLFGQQEDVLVVKGSGADLATVTASGFTRLSLQRTARLARRQAMTDEDMMAFFRACMIDPQNDPLPSVETPLHAVLPARVIVHTHDLASLSLTNLDEAASRRCVAEAFRGRVAWTPYVRPGFPLARHMLETANQLAPDLHGLVLAHHGLVVWADDEETCYRRLLDLVSTALDWIGQQLPSTGTTRVTAAPPAPPQRRRQAAACIMPVLRGALSREERVILHLDDSPRTLELMRHAAGPGRADRGMATPEHLLRCGRRAVSLTLDLESDEAQWRRQVTDGMDEASQAYQSYHLRHSSGEAALQDWCKTVLVPEVGLITAFKDRPQARLAAVCARTWMEVMGHADHLGGFRSIPEAEEFHFEHWPLERRKVEETMARERRDALLNRHIALVLGGASGIGEAAAHGFADAGAHVVVADLDGEGAQAVAAAIGRRHPDRALGLVSDCRQEDSIRQAVERTILHFGGLDALFYTPGLAPRFAPLAELRREDFQAQMDVHYIGALLAVQAAAAVMKDQGLGGSLICSVSKAALSPGKQAAAYGGSKAGLQHALRIAAMELGADDIRVNAINADQVETPLFLRFAQARADARGVSLEEQLAGYRERNALRASLIPARAVGDLAVLLASERFRYTTGDIITIDGGLPDAFPR